MIAKGIENFKQLIRIALVFGLCMLAFAVIAMSAGENDSHGNALVNEVATVVQPREPQATNLKSPPKAVRNDLYRQLVSGVRSSEEIQTEMAQMAGQGAGLEFSKEFINRAYKLSIVMSQYKNTQGDPYEVLFVHTLASGSGKGNEAEDTVTFYSRKLDGAEEANTRGNLVFSRTIEISDKGEPQFATSSRLNYKFSLEQNKIKSNFHMRAPEGVYDSAAAGAGDFDPLAVLTNPDSPFDFGLYHQEVSQNGKVYDVKVTLRSTELETLTFEVRVQEQKSLSSQTFILVYEEL
jgi:hypothetical protein